MVKRLLLPLIKKLEKFDHAKYISTPEFNKFDASIFDMRLKRANLQASRAMLVLFQKYRENRKTANV